MNTVKIISILLLSLTLLACASRNAGDVYTRGQTRQAQTIKMGVVESIRQVKIEGTKTPIGSTAGGVIGGVAGSSAGSGKGKIITAAIGAVVGGVVGAAAEETFTRKDGLEITVKFDNGQLLAYVQEATDEKFAVGDKVRVLEGAGVSRVSH